MSPLILQRKAGTLVAQYLKMFIFFKGYDVIAKMLPRDGDI